MQYLLTYDIRIDVWSSNITNEDLEAESLRKCDAWRIIQIWFLVYFKYGAKLKLGTV